jgi:hypothetical protein
MEQIRIESRTNLDFGIRNCTESKQHSARVSLRAVFRKSLIQKDIPHPLIAKDLWLPYTHW